jgi:DNA transformation protein
VIIDPANAERVREAGQHVAKDRFDWKQRCTFRPMTPARDQDFLDFVQDQLSRLPKVSAKRMFGAVGLYQDAAFFAIIDEGRLYFLTGEASRKRYIAQGMKPFEYAPGKTLHTYYEVPVDVLEDERALCEWAREAVTVQESRRRKRAARTPGQPRRKARSQR